MGLIWWHCDSMQPLSLFTDYITYTGLGADDSMVGVKDWIDPIVCLRHVLYQHYYKGILVEGSEFREHIDPNSNSVVLSNGVFVEGLDLSTETILTEQVALDSALNYINAELYAWEDDSSELSLQLDSIPGITTYYPKGELVFALVGDRSILPENYKLAWKFDIEALEPHLHLVIYVDAITGEIIKESSLMCNSSNHDHVYYGNQNIDTRWYGGLKNKHILEANNNGRNFRTKSGNNSSWFFRNTPGNSSQNWGNNHENPASTHHSVQIAWDFFNNEYLQNGFDGNGRAIRVWGAIPNFENAYFNAKPNKNYDYLGFGFNGQNVLSPYDIAGHEFAHGITRYSANLVYERESGALNESFSDIFGLMVERFGKNGSFDWTIGEDANFTIRDMEIPENHGQPSWYLTHPNWVNVRNCNPNRSNNFCGVHTNSGVQNKYFNLLSEGGTQLGVNVQGIGVSEAALISYFSLSVLHGSNDTYPLAREHAVAAARIIFRRCSFQEREVCRAWAACNVGAECPCIPPGPEPQPVTSCWMYGCGNAQSVFTKVETFDNEKKIIIYPNPASDLIHLKGNEAIQNELKANGKLTLKIIDVMGKTNMNINLNYDALTKGINIKQLTTGLYFIVISNGINYNQTFKLFKE